MRFLYYFRIILSLVTLALLPARSWSAPFTPGNIVIARVGATGSTSALTSAATDVFLDEYTLAGLLVQTVVVPNAITGNNRPLTASGSSTSELQLTRSVDGHALALAGYGAVPGTAAVAATATTAVIRVVGLVGADGSVDTSTNLGPAFSGAAVRSATTVDGSSFYVAGSGPSTGSGSGIQYVPFAGFTPTQINTTPVNNRVVNIFNGNLYLSSGAPGFLGLSSVGTGLPTSGPQTVTLLPGPVDGGTGASPYAFYFADLSTTVPGVDVVYVADDRSTVDGGIQKWSLVGSTWVFNGVITGTTVALRGLNGSVTGTTVSLIATSATALYVVADNAGYNVVPSATVLPAAVATAPTNTAFRGVALAPTFATPTITSFTPTTGAADGTVTVTITGTSLGGATAVTLNGVTITGFTVVNATTITFVVPTGTTSGPITVTTPGGTATSTGTFTVIVPNPVPTITSLSPASVAAGSGPVVITITGTGFLPTSTVTFDGVSLPVTYTSATQLSISLSTGAVTGTYPVIVTNPAPGGGASAAFSFTVTPAATITSLLPNTKVAGSASFTLTVNGTNFVSGSVVTFNGVVLTTTYVSVTQLTASVPASAVATVGTFNVTVTNPASSVSAPSTFTVTAPAPTITSFTPTAGGPGTVVTVTGTNLTGATPIRIGSFNVPVFTVVNATTITFMVPSGTGSVSGLITVVTPGGTATSATPFNLVSATLAAQALPGLTVFPNPAIDRVTVALPTAAAATVALRDLTGRVVLAPAALAADHQLLLPASLASGIYLLEVQQSGVRAVRRIEKR